MSEMKKAIEELSEKTGVSAADVEKLLTAIGIDKSYSVASDTISANALQNIRASDLVAGIKFGRVMVHM